MELTPAVYSNPPEKKVISPKKLLLLILGTLLILVGLNVAIYFIKRSPPNNIVSRNKSVSTESGLTIEMLSQLTDSDKIVRDISISFAGVIEGIDGQDILVNRKGEAVKISVDTDVPVYLLIYTPEQEVILYDYGVSAKGVSPGFSKGEEKNLRDLKLSDQVLVFLEKNDKGSLVVKEINAARLEP